MRFGDLSGPEHAGQSSREGYKALSMPREAFRSVRWTASLCWDLSLFPQNKSGYSYHRLLGFKPVCRK